MSDPNAPEGPEFQGPWQQRQPGFQPPQDPRNSPIDYNPIPPQPQQPLKSRGRWLRRVALVAPALLVGACVGSLGATGDAEGGVSAVPASAPTATVTASVPGPTVTASVPGPTVTAKAEKPKPAPTVTVTVEAEQPKPEAKPEPESEPKPESKPASNMSRSQEQAVGQAESYLENQNFSRKGLIEQLEYEEFSKADATFAVDHIDVNWNKQAAGQAESYLEGQHFSRSGLIEQLKYEGFTQSQAEYGVKAVGL